jgi:hypothetical protein
MSLVNNQPENENFVKYPVVLPSEQLIGNCRHLRRHELTCNCTDPQIVHAKWGEVDITTIAITHVSRDSVQHDLTQKENLQLSYV